MVLAVTNGQTEKYIWNTVGYQSHQRLARGGRKRDPQMEMFVAGTISVISPRIGVWSPQFRLSFRCIACQLPCLLFALFKIFSSFSFLEDSHSSKVWHSSCNQTFFSLKTLKSYSGRTATILVLGIGADMGLDYHTSVHPSIFYTCFLPTLRVAVVCCTVCAHTICIVCIWWFCVICVCTAVLWQ